MFDPFQISDELDEKVNSTGIESLSEAEKTFYLVWSFEAEINNGGFDQFFFNSTGNHAADIITALETINAMECAAICRRACALFPNARPSSIQNERQKQLFNITDEVEEAFEDLDQEFYRYPDDIGGLLKTYWMSRDDESCS